MNCSAKRWFHFFLFSLILPASWAGNARVRIPRFWLYDAEVADFGLPLEDDAWDRSVLILPPDDPQLCEFPSSLVDENNNTIPLNRSYPVAMLVQLGGCEVSTKAAVALEISKSVTSTMKYVIFYNNDSEKPYEIESI